MWNRRYYYREKIKKAACWALIIILLPYIVTVFVNGPKIVTASKVDEMTIDVKGGGKMPVEKYCIGILARDMPAEYEEEALKAQAILVRTEVYRAIRDAGEGQKLEKEFWTEKQMKSAWGMRYAENYRKLKNALESTAGQAAKETGTSKIKNEDMTSDTDESDSNGTGKGGTTTGSGTTDSGTTGTSGSEGTGTSGSSGQTGTQATAGKSHNINFTEDSYILWPVNGAVIMSYSMDKTVYFQTLDQYKYNPAVIIEGAEGDQVLCGAPGIVKSIDVSAQTGTTVNVDIGNGYELLYGQLKEVPVKVGDYVEAKSVLGYVSQPTKYYSKEGCNVYFEMRKDGQPVNPVEYTADQD